MSNIKKNKYNGFRIDFLDERTKDWFAVFQKLLCQLRSTHADVPGSEDPAGWTLLQEVVSPNREIRKTWKVQLSEANGGGDSF